MAQWLRSLILQLLIAHHLITVGSLRVTCEICGSGVFHPTLQLTLLKMSGIILMGCKTKIKKKKKDIEASSLFDITQFAAIRLFLRAWEPLVLFWLCFSCLLVFWGTFFKNYCGTITRPKKAEVTPPGSRSCNSPDANSSPWSDATKWAISWQNQQNGMCTQWRLRSARSSAQSDQSSLSAWRKFGFLSYPLSTSEDWSDWAESQADLSSLGAHAIL